MVFPGVVHGCELDYKENWGLKNWCFWPVVLEKTLKSPLDCKKIKPVNPKGNQYRIFIGRTDAEAETPILWLPDVKNWLLGKDLDAGKAEGKSRRGRQKMRWLDGSSPTRWTWVWASSGSWWWTGKPCMLQSMGSQRVRHDCQLNWLISMNTEDPQTNTVLSGIGIILLPSQTQYMCSISKILKIY